MRRRHIKIIRPTPEEDREICEAIANDPEARELVGEEWDRIGRELAQERRDIASGKLYRAPISVFDHQPRRWAGILLYDLSQEFKIFIQKFSWLNWLWERIMTHEKNYLNIPTTELFPRKSKDAS